MLNPGWRGDALTTLKRYWRRVCIDGKGSSGSVPRWVFVQRDWAQKHPGGAYTFHGRSDEVMNLCGIVIGTEIIESAILRDKHLHPATSPVGDCAVVGHPHVVYGELPLAFVTPAASGSRLQEEDMKRISSLVFEAVGNVGLQFVKVPELPRTQTGKIMRSLLRALIRDDRVVFMRAAGAVQNPGCLRYLQRHLNEWRQLHPHFMQGTGKLAREQVVNSSDEDSEGCGACRGHDSSGELVMSSAVEGTNVDEPQSPHMMPPEAVSLAGKGLGRNMLAVADAGVDKDHSHQSNGVDAKGLSDVGGRIQGSWKQHEQEQPRRAQEEAWQVTLDLRHLAAFGTGAAMIAVLIYTMQWRRNASTH